MKLHVLFFSSIFFISGTTCDRCLANICKNKANSIDNSLVSYFGGKLNQSTRLISSNILETHIVENEKICMKKCYSNANCFSINYCEDLTCELLSENLYLHENKLVQNVTWNHTSVASAGCEKKPCLNGGTCSPYYNNGSFACICTSKFSGKYCQINTFTNPYDILSIARPAYEFKFDDLTNTGANTYLTLSMYSGKLVYTGDRTGKVLFNEHRWGISISPGSENTDCITNLQCTNGVTISFSVKLSRQNIEKLKAQSEDNKIVVVTYANSGISLQYHYKLKAFQGIFLDEQGYMTYLHTVKNPYEWNHFAFHQTPSPIQRSFYVNGNFTNTTFEKSSSQPSPTCGGITYSFFSQQCFNKHSVPSIYYADDFRYWTKALTHDEIKALFSNNLI